MNVYENIISTLKQNNVVYQEYEHWPILSYEDAEREQAVCGWNGVESKNVCLMAPDGSCCIYVTIAGRRVDMKNLKELTGNKYRLAEGEELKSHTYCVPGCVSPFGFGEEILLVIDEDVFSVGDYLFSPGVATKTIQMDASHLRDIFSHLPNKKLYTKGA